MNPCMLSFVACFMTKLSDEIHITIHFYLPQLDPPFYQNDYLLLMS